MIIHRWKNRRLVCISVYNRQTLKNLFGSLWSKTNLTSYGCFHPREGDSSNDTFTEAQQERASLFFLEEGFLFAFAHEPHDVATVQIESSWKTTNFSYLSGVKDISWTVLYWAQVRKCWENIPIPPKVFKVWFHHHEDAIKPHIESVGRIFLWQNRLRRVIDT